MPDTLTRFRGKRGLYEKQPSEEGLFAVGDRPSPLCVIHLRAITQRLDVRDYFLRDIIIADDAAEFTVINLDDADTIGGNVFARENCILAGHEYLQWLKAHGWQIESELWSWQVQ
ncbi:hypothetical protein ABIF38_005681 [Bradyrhizobium japonicum]|uniref:hypothetical protein n=1 Tax=Bradyrhizobium elkanii TaxID=29448 RepID=UPI00039ADC30|nr:hypothetical protein [Bradyrhizobium elkanii]MBP2434755.1 hypothetical protein [Bradyrhizobium elkanii]MCP1732009.1 hypothetical protein [Bradyrhizobium elkanii]MCS3567343.1 hypothetical protein [Bradyrhizobium elkanii]MCS3591172.1 hypothetical protein [Bradyrhizobium elkanii]MCS3620615.1 hypothetical protein [Bradyrhizobium elkanii]